MHSFHSPFGLSKRVPSPDTRMDVLPLVTVLLVAVMLSLAGSRFIYAPGLTVGLGGDPAFEDVLLPATLALPESSLSLAGVATDATLTVFSAKSDNLFIFEGRIYSSSDEKLKSDLKAAAQRSPVLLVKPDRSLSVQTLFLIINQARDAGFKQVQLAGESRATL